MTRRDYFSNIYWMNTILISIKITLLTIAFVMVSYGIYHLKTRGISPVTRQVLGVPQETQVRKAKFIQQKVDIERKANR